MQAFMASLLNPKSITVFVSYKAWAQGIAHKEMKKSKQVPHSLEQAVLGFEPRQSGVSVYILHL